jgi:predicted GH43/DUF377 family glycosyl hydrolase
MALTRLQTRNLLLPENFSPSQDRLKVIGVFNPGAIEFNGKILLLVRVAEAVQDTAEGHILSPRVNRNSTDGADRYVIDDLPIKKMDDPRKPLLANGLRRLSSISHLEIVECDRQTDNVLSIQQRDELFPREAYETYGIEDARICPIGDAFIITYTAVSPWGVASAVMKTEDFTSFKRLGILFPPENKNVVIWRQDNGPFFALHRPTGFTAINRHGIWLSESPDSRHWGKHVFLFGPNEQPWESGKIGIATPPIELPEGLLVLYHAVEFRDENDQLGIYRIGGVLLDKMHPQTILGRSRAPLIEPETDFETTGFVPQVVFATGAVLNQEKKELQVYYGAADTSVATLYLPIQSIVESILLH